MPTQQRQVVATQELEATLPPEAIQSPGAIPAPRSQGELRPTPEVSYGPATQPTALALPSSFLLVLCEVRVARSLLSALDSKGTAGNTEG